MNIASEQASTSHKQKANMGGSFAGKKVTASKCHRGT